MNPQYGICDRCGRSSSRSRVKGKCRPCYATVWNATAAERNVPAFGSGPHRRTTTSPLVNRLLAKVAAGHGGCWIWAGTRNADGYGLISLSRAKSDFAHRVSYQLLVGPIPPGLQIDHRCRVRACVNPAHLEAVTCQVNILRSPFTVASRLANRTHCNHGHEFTEANTAWARSGRGRDPDRRYRECRECRNLRARKAASA
jgi:hypothetical protein